MPERASLADTAVENLRSQLHEIRPDLRVESGFRATTGLSPTLLVLISVIPAGAITIAAVLTKTWLLLLVAAVAMVVAIVLLFRLANEVRVVAVAQSELVVFGRRHGELVEIARHPRGVIVEPYWDRQWIKVRVGEEHLWVSRRVFDPIIEQLAAPSTGAS